MVLTFLAKKGLGLLGKSKTVSGLQHPVLDRLKIKKNLTTRRKDRDEVVAGVDKHLKSDHTNASKIKKKYTDRVSKLNDKLEKKLDKLK
tara:strand:+ start:302 stop:568 length:267 start_codon:yes stop_codon:yes gene_type:complete